MVRPRCGGFSLIELMTVLSITVLLAGILLPVVRSAHENVQRVVSASNLRQMGLAITMYADDERDRLPYSRVLEIEKAPQELMVVRLSTPDPTMLGDKGWDGIGRLYSYAYLRIAEVYYAPSHRGEHPLPRYEDAWLRGEPSRIYANYHYCGHADWETGEFRRLDEGDRMLLATDGLRTRGDLNHRWGMNVLRGDGAVAWAGVDEDFTEQLPVEPVLENSTDDPFLGLWSYMEMNLEF